MSSEQGAVVVVVGRRARAKKVAVTEACLYRILYQIAAMLCTGCCLAGTRKGRGVHVQARSGGWGLMPPALRGASSGNRG
jgi:hypothetical protein